MADSNRVTRRLQGIVIGVIVGALLAGGVAYAARVVPPSGTDRYYACVGSAGAVHERSIRLNSPPTSCQYPNDKIRSWNAQGPTGATGSSGATGPTGPTGSAAMSAKTARVALPAFALDACNGTSDDWVATVPGSVGCTDSPSASAFAVPLNFSDYPANATAHFTGVFTAWSSAPSLACFRMYDLDAAAQVPGTFSCHARAANDDTYQSFDEGPFVLPNALHHYLLQSRVEYPNGDGWSGGIAESALVIDW